MGSDSSMKQKRSNHNFDILRSQLIRDNINDYQIDDFEIHNYQSYDANKMKMVA